MAVSQAFIFHFKCYSILRFAVCQLLRWAFLLKRSTELNDVIPIVDCVRTYVGLRTYVPTSAVKCHRKQTANVKASILAHTQLEKN